MKQIIVVIIIVVALAGAGFLGYKAFTSSSEDNAAAVAGKHSQILPFGTDLKFDSVQKYNKDGKTFQYPTVTPAEIGPELGAIIK